MSVVYFGKDVKYFDVMKVVEACEINVYQQIIQHVLA